ncbi:hypothetical protein IW148_000707 [Coemansia sp. RSA 1199]|nr:hypothetical protein IW148_000707 [Coemansia sp. RSA 1199]
MLGQLLATLCVAGVGYSTVQWLRPLPSVHGARVVIVGASSGIGKCLALEYARRGARLLLCARRHDELTRVQHECEKYSPHVHIVTGDITHHDTQQQLLDMATMHFDGHVDYLVLNAGAISVQQVVDLWGMRSNDGLCVASSTNAARADTAMRAIMEINVFAPIRLSTLFLPLLVQAKGTIVVVSSMAGLIAAPTRSLYSASKHAVSGYFSALRMEMHEWGVHVTVAYPGTVDTQLRESAVDRDEHRAAGSERGKMPPSVCARQILHAASCRQPSLVTPRVYWFSSILYAFAPRLVEYLAHRKYGL